MARASRQCVPKVSPKEFRASWDAPGEETIRAHGVATITASGGEKREKRMTKRAPELRRPLTSIWQREQRPR